MNRAVLCMLAMIMLSAVACAEDGQASKQRQPPPNEVKLDMVSDTVAQTFDKANAILSGNLEVTMSEKEKKKDDYTINAMGLRVPTKTAIKTGSALHDDEPL